MKTYAQLAADHYQLHMRKIKFRIWNGIEMIHDVTVGKFGTFYVNPGDKGTGLDPKDSASLTPFTTKYSDNTPLMQFTGLLDKNGKEIYEGDIITCHTNNKFKYPHKGEVLWLEHIAGFGITAEDIVNDIGESQSAFTYFNYNENFEIIGNIYFNPDLLKQPI